VTKLGTFEVTKASTLTFDKGGNLYLYVLLLVVVVLLLHD